jgi:glycine oxidase
VGDHYIAPVETKRGSDVVVIGGGVIGCSVALSLACEGVTVTLVEGGRIGQGASRAAAGMLSPLGESTAPGPFLDLGLASLALYPAFIETVRGLSGIDPGFLPSGGMDVATSQEGMERIRARETWARLHDPAAAVLSALELRERVPGIGDDAVGALHLPGDHQVDNRLLTPALAEAARRRGVRILEGSAACGVVQYRARVEGVMLANGHRIPAGQVVLCSGHRGVPLEGVAPLPVHPVRGQMAALGPVPGAPRPLLHGHGVYLVTRRNGRILVGATVESVGARAWVTPDAIASLVLRGRALLPVLQEVPVTEVWAGLRPGTPDGLPILGADPGLEGLLHAGGHYRNGILLAPVTSQVVTDLVLGRPTALDLTPFLPGRFPVTVPGDAEGHPHAGGR